jgi:predicted alpha-1,2-mannosidase
MKTPYKLTGLLLLSFCIHINGYTQNSDSLVNYVDLRIGTYNDGSNCVIGPQMPFGSINPSPQTPGGNMAGYDPSQPIRGFGQLHVSGTGWGKYGQIFVSPQIGLAVGENDHDSPKSNETAHPYEYGVTLNRYNIRTEFVPSFHSAMYRFVFPESANANVLIDLTHNIPMDIASYIGGSVSQGTISIDQANMGISGFGKYSGGFGSGDYIVYFSAIFNRNPDSVGTWLNGKIQNRNLTGSIIKTNDRVGAYFKFKTKANDTLVMKISVSFKSIEQANTWLNKEIPDWNYEKLKTDAKITWNNELSKIRIETESLTDVKIFYTAMYHAMLMPRNRTDDMHGFPEGNPVWDDQYAVWDTWRSLFPLMALINPSMVAGNINSFIERFKLNTYVHDAYIAGNDMAEEQGGNNPDNIIADAYIKGLDGVDWNEAYTVIKHDADAERAGWQGKDNFGISDTIMGSYKTEGWIPAGIMSCSKSLEYSYNDFCAAQISKGLGKSDDYNKYFERSQLWINLWNPSAKSDGYKGFIVPKNTKGSFLDIDLKTNWGSWKEYFYEGNSWTYSLFVPHEFPRLIWLSGGNSTYAAKLDYAFNNNLIEYSNEPAFLAVYSFIYACRPDMTSFWVRKLLLNGFSLTGYPGNDDSGAMSSWYIFNSMGFFPNAGQNIYYLTGSLFNKVTLTLADKKQLIIETENTSKTNIYVQSCTLNGKAWDKAWLVHDSIKNGAVIKFVMGPNPSSWAKNDSSFKYYGTGSDSILTMSQNKMVFTPYYSGYPVPFADYAHIRTYIPENIKTVRLNLYNSKGIGIKTILITQRGNSVIKINGSNLKPGFYFFSFDYDGEYMGSGKLAKI